MPIHPEISARFHLLEGITSFEAAFADPLQRARLDQFMSVTDAPAPPAAVTEDTVVPGPRGPVPVRVYRPPTARPQPDPTPRPGLVWMHGGGFRVGDLDMPEADRTAREMVGRAGAVVVSVDYRLAVDGVHHPVPHNDVVAAVRWVRDGAEHLGVDPARVSVGGASAGANLAAGAALRLRDDDGWQPAALLLAYPVAHAVLPPASAPLAALMAEVPPVLRFPPPAVEFLTVNLLGRAVSAADGYAMPALGVLAGLAPTLVLNAEYDDLRASGEAFTAALAVAGVDVRQVLVEGMLHGFLNTRPDFAPVDRALDLLAELTSLARVQTATHPS